MTFTEENRTAGNNGWHYETTDLFGTITIDAVRQLDRKELDDIVVEVLRASTPEGTIKDVGTYAFEKDTEWVKDEPAPEPVEITDEDRAELGRLVSEGLTSGRLDCGDGKHITWSLTAEAWSDDEETTP